MTKRTREAAVASMHRKHTQIKQIPCPICGAPVFMQCRTPNGQTLQIPHQARRRAAADAGIYTP